MFYQPYGMQLRKYEECIKYLKIQLKLHQNEKILQYYDLANGLNLNNNNNNNDSINNSQNRVTESNLFL